jgi:homoaconitate hydratase
MFTSNINTDGSLHCLAFGCFSAGNPLGFVFGTILAGLFTEIFSWRAGFFLLAIVYFCTTVIAYFTVPGDTTPKQSLNDETVKKLDLPGTAMTILGIGMFCAALRYVSLVSTPFACSDSA